MTYTRTVKLGELVSFRTGKLDSNAAVPGGRFPFFTCSQQTLRTDTFSFDCECVLLAGNNATGTFPIKYFKGKFDAYQRTYVIRPLIASDLDVRFLYFSMRLKLDSMKSLSTGATTKFLTLPILNSIEIALPPIATQSKIAGMLAVYDDLIDINRRRLELLEQMARAIYKEWFVHFRYPGHESPTLVDSPLGPIPEGWRVLPFSEVASFVNGFAFKPSHWGSTGRPIIKIKELKEGVTKSTPRRDEETIDTKFWVAPGDLLFSWSADLGVYRWPGEPGLLNQHLFIVKSRTLLPTSWLFHSLASAMPQFWKRAQGTTMRHIKRAALTEVLAVVPPAKIVDSFTSIVEPIDMHVIGLRQSISNLAATRDLLLPKLVTGQIDVSSPDLDTLVESSVA